MTRVTLAIFASLLSAAATAQITVEERDSEIEFDGTNWNSRQRLNAVTGSNQRFGYSIDMDGLRIAATCPCRAVGLGIPARG